MSHPVEIGSLKVNSLIIIDGEPCKIVSMEKSKPGKHGAAKVRVVAIGLFDGVKRSIVSPVDAMVEVPIVDKRVGQVVAVTDTVQLMDTETYEVFEVPLPEEEDIRKKLEPGVQVEYWQVLNRRKIVRVKSE